MHFYELSQHAIVTLDADGASVVQIPLEAWKAFMADTDARLLVVRHVEDLLLSIDAIREQVALLPKKEPADDNEEYQRNAINDIAGSLHKLWMLIELMRLIAPDQTFDRVIERHLRQTSILPGHIAQMCDFLLNGTTGTMSESEQAVVREMRRRAYTMRQSLRYLTAQVAPAVILTNLSALLENFRTMINILQMHFSLQPEKMAVLDEIRRILDATGEQMSRVSAVDLLTVDFTPQADLIRTQLQYLKQSNTSPEMLLIVSSLERDIERLATWSENLSMF